MKLAVSSLFLCLVAAPLIAEDNPQNTPPECFTALFNGKDGIKGGNFREDGTDLIR